MKGQDKWRQGREFKERQDKIWQKIVPELIKVDRKKISILDAFNTKKNEKKTEMKKGVETFFVNEKVAYQKLYNI